MNRLAVLLVPLGIASCNTVPFDVVSIRPIFGYVDGCASVKISGHGMAESTTVDLVMEGGTAALESVVPAASDPALADDSATAEDEGARLREINAGFYVLGATPVSPAGVGYADVVVTSEGASATIEKGFYYVECPASAYVEFLGGNVAPGGTVEASGCGLAAGTVQALVTPLDGYGLPTAEPAVAVPLTAGCKTASATFTMPAFTGAAYVAVEAADAQGNPISIDCTGLDTAYFCLVGPAIASYGGAE